MQTVLSRKFFISAAAMCAMGSGLLLASAQQAYAQTGLVISQVYGGGGSSTAGTTYTQDFIELFNGSGSAVTLTGYSLQYASAAGTFNLGTSGLFSFASGTVIQNNSYYLVATGTAGSAGATITNADATGTINISNTGGKVALANSTSAVTASTGPNSTFSTNVVDFVGFGTATAYEGSGAAPQPTNTATSLIRTMNTAGTGFIDTNNNAADFILTAANSPGPRSSAMNTPEPGSLALGLAALPVLGGIGLRRRTLSRKARAAHA